MPEGGDSGWATAPYRRIDAGRWTLSSPESESSFSSTVASGTGAQNISFRLWPTQITGVPRFGVIRSET